MEENNKQVNEKKLTCGQQVALGLAIAAAITGGAIIAANFIAENEMETCKYGSVPIHIEEAEPSIKFDPSKEEMICDYGVISPSKDVFGFN